MEEPNTQSKKSEVTKKDVNKNTNEVDFDELLSSAGEFGRYQFILLLSTLPFYVFGVFAYFSQMFMTEISPNHWCWIPELNNLSDIDRRNLGIPSDAVETYGYSHCRAFVANWSEVLELGLKPNSSWNTEPCKHGWEFNKTEIPYPTISSDMEWVCDKASYQATAQSIFFIGSIVGGFLVGWVGDKYGRLPAAIFSNMIGCVAGVASVFARNLIQFSLCRFVMGMSYDNCMMMAYLLVVEYVAPKYRTLSANIPSGVFYTLGLVIIPWIAIACGHWKTFGLVTSSSMALALLTPLILPESPRWLLSKGRVEDAVEKVLRIGRVNKKTVPKELLERFKLSAAKKEQETHLSILDLLRRPILRKVFASICIFYMCCMIIFDALVRIVGTLAFDFFLSFTLASLTELPSLFTVAFVSDLLGRKCLTITSFTICCTFSILTPFMAAGSPSLITSIIARFAANMACYTGIQWATENLPTPVRGSGASIVHIFGNMGTVISPYIVYLHTFVPGLPLIIVGCISALGAVITLAIPETAGLEMPQTFSDAENIAKNQKLLSLPFLRKLKQKNTEGKENSSYEIN